MFCDINLDIFSKFSKNKKRTSCVFDHGICRFRQIHSRGSRPFVLNKIVLMFVTVSGSLVNITRSPFEGDISAFMRGIPQKLDQTESISSKFINKQISVVKLYLSFFLYRHYLAVKRVKAELTVLVHLECRSQILICLLFSMDTICIQQNLFHFLFP